MNICKLSFKILVSCQALVFSIIAGAEIVPPLHKAMILTTDRNCNLYIEQTCQQSNPAQFSLWAAEEIDTIREKLGLQSGFIHKTIKYSKNNKELCSFNRMQPQLSVDYQQADRGAVDSDFVIQWWSNAETAKFCVALKMNTDDKTAYKPVTYPDIYGRIQQATNCDSNLGNSISKLVEHLNLRCVLGPTLIDKDSRFEKPNKTQENVKVSP